MYSRCISTHSLTKRLTRSFVGSPSTNLSFQLTASRRGWRRFDKVEWATGIFQLTASRRGWRLAEWIDYVDAIISTHSLTKRLTWAEVYWRCSTSDFNSQPHEEADECHETDTLYCFISTHSLTKRLTRQKGHFYASYRNFNSQPHEEADDFSGYGLEVRGVISTHSLTKRLTMTGAVGYTQAIISTHSLTKRLTWNGSGFLRESFISTHSLTKRLTQKKVIERLRGIFQLTASRRGWLPNPYAELSAQDISTHSLTKRLTAISHNNF